MDWEAGLEILVSGTLERAERHLWQRVRRELAPQWENQGLRIVDFIALRTVESHPGISIRDLSARLGLSHSTVSGMVRRHEKLGLVRREVNDQDKRAWQLYVSDGPFQEQRSRIQALTGEVYREWLAKLSPEEKIALQTGMKGLARILDDATGTRMEAGVPPAAG